MRPYLSTIVPVYNSGMYLHECIESILAQTFQDFELLLINDGSTDGSGAICDDYASKDVRIRVFHKKNEGVSSARNLGLDNARGKWVCFVDSDDHIDQNLFQDTIHHSTFDLITFSSKEFGAAFSVNGVNKDIEYNLPKDAYCIYNFSPNDKTRTPYLLCWSHLYKKNIIDAYNLRFNTELRYGEDTIFIVNYLQHCQNIIQLSKAYYYYRIEDNAFRKKYRLSGEETNTHCKALTETFLRYCRTWNCPMPQLYYSNFVTYLKAYYNFLIFEKDFNAFRNSLKRLDIKYKQLRYAGRKLPILLYIMRKAPHISFFFLRQKYTYSTELR